MESLSKGLIFAKHSFGTVENEIIVLSPVLKNILRIVSALDHEGKEQCDLYVYSVDKNTGSDDKNVRLICHKIYFDFPRFIFSDNGKQLLIYSDNCIYNFGFDDTGIHDRRVIPLVELYKTSNIFKTDFVPFDVVPVQLKDNSITICINQHWLLAFQFHPDLTLSLRYCVEITNDVSCLQHTNDKVHCLTSYGNIFSYNINNGSLSNVFDIYSVIPNDVQFEKFVVHTNNQQIAMFNNSREVYIFEISSFKQYGDCIEETSFYRSSGRSGCGSVKSFMTNVSRTTTYSRSESIHSVNYKPINRISASNTPKSWISYLQKLSSQNKMENIVGELPQSKSFVCIKDLPENTLVKNIHFYSYNSLGIWCVSQECGDDNFYRVYDSNTGQLEMTELLNPTTQVIPLNCPGINLDAFVGPNTLSVPLVFTPKEVFINKLLNCVGSDCVAWLLELDKSLSQSMQPLSLLKDALKDTQFHLVKLSLNLHLQELKRELTKKSVEIKSIIETTKTVMDVMIAVVQDPATKESFNQKILLEALLHANKILSLLQAASEEILIDLKVEVLKRVVRLRSGLRKPQPLPVEDTARLSWSTWEVLSDKEVIKEGVKDLPLVHCFLIMRRHWTSSDIVEGRFKQLLTSIVIDFLQTEQLTEAQNLLKQAGYVPASELSLICKNTLNRSLRDYLMTALSNEIGKDFVKAWMFIKVVESILDRYTIPNPYLDYPQGPNAKLTLSNVMSYTSETRTHILTDLYFNTQDSTLVKFLVKEVCWDFLLNYNCVEGLHVWIDCFLDKRQPVESSAWPINLFLQWSITQEMIDHITEGDVAEYTRETVLNHLARFGLFLSSEKINAEAVIKRLANSKLLLQYKGIFEKPTANINVEDFDRIMLKYAVKHDLIDVVTMSVPQKLVLEEVHIKVEDRSDWFSLWKLFCEVSTTWENKGIIRLLTETTGYLAQGDVSIYLKKHPFLAIATNLLEKKEISRIHAYFSPIIAVMTATEPLYKDVTVYTLLAGTVPFYTDSLFQFQPDQNRMNEGYVLQMPDFTNEELSKKYGHNQSLRFTDRIKQGRPSQAVVQLFDKNGRISVQIKKHAYNAAHGLALYHALDSVIVSSCIAFIEMLGKDPDLVRTHIACALVIQKNKQFEIHNFKALLYNIVSNQDGAVEELLRQVEQSLESQWEDKPDTLQCLKQNQLPIHLAALHGLPPSYMILKYAAKTNNWVLFLLAAQIFQYPLKKVQEYVAEFSCNKLREHLYYAMAIELIEQIDMNTIATESLDITKVKAGSNSCKLECKSELFANIAQCHNNAEEMLKMSRRVGNPVLALLASCLKSKSVISPFCTWLVTSIDREKTPLRLDEPWTSSKVLELLELVVQLKYIQILVQAFSIFFAENPLQIFSTFLLEAVLYKKFEASILTLKTFIAACLNLSDKSTGRIMGFMKNKSWIANAAVRMASVALVYCFKSTYHQNKFLKILADSQFGQHLPVSAPDYFLLSRLSSCLAHTDISIDYAQLCLHDNRSQLTQLLQLLVDRQDFRAAFRFASTAGLSLGSVYVADWSVRAKTEEGREPEFWSNCQKALDQASIEPQLAADFYRKQAALMSNPQDRFVLLKYALEWMKKLPAGDDYLKEESSVRLDLYLTVLQEGFNIQMVTEGLVYTPLHYLTSDLERNSHLSLGVSKLNSEERYKLDTLIHKLLEVGDIMTVVNLQDVFEHVNQDYELIFACMSLAEGGSVHQLPNFIQDLLNIDSTAYLSSRPKLLASSPRYSKQNLQLKTLEDQQKLLNTLYALQAHQTCSTAMFRNIINAYKVATALGLEYKEVIKHPDSLSLLQIEDDFEMAGYIINLAGLRKTELEEYLAEQLISVIHCPVDDRYMLWGCDLDTQFSRVLNLEGVNPLMLGNLLLSSVPRLDSKQLITLREAVELLIRSHDCFTKACNMEGISSILTMSAELVNLLLDCCQWALMVRLLTGVGRYTEMKYIFEILKDRDQFEYLLGKGLDKHPGLMAALLDFVRNDKPRYKLVALHFCMYSELAILFKEEAENELKKLEKTQDGSLLRNEYNKQCLQGAMNKYADATTHYIQANKQKKGVICIQKAELVALQLSLMVNTPSSQNVHCLINLPPDKVTAVILSCLSYDQACIVSAAYNLAVDWSAALYHHCVVLGETAYLNSWCQHNQFTMTIVQDVARRFQNSNTVNPSVETNMKWFLSSVNQVDIKYRICSQLGFKDLLQTILSGPDLAYLKDTVWQKGFKYQHL